MSSMKTIIDELNKQGLRVTKIRKNVLKTLIDSGKALNRKEIHKFALDNGSYLDPVSIYRSLLLLEKKGILHRLSGTNSYIVKNLSVCDNFQYAICERCGIVMPITGPNIDDLTSEAEAVSGFKIRKLTFEYIGLCKGCSNGAVKTR